VLEKTRSSNACSVVDFCISNDHPSGYTLREFVNLAQVIKHPQNLQNRGE
jgi:hypothetical protein